MKRIINILLLLLLVQTITFAQGVGVDSVQVVNVLPDTCFNKTIADSVKLKSVPFETIEREGGKYYAVTSDGHKEEITSFINGRKRVMVKDGDDHELVIDKDGNVMGVEEYTKCGGSSKLLSEYNAYRDSTMATSGNVKFSKVKDENYGFDEWRGADYSYDSCNTRSIIFFV